MTKMTKEELYAATSLTRIEWAYIYKKYPDNPDAQQAAAKKILARRQAKWKGLEAKGKLQVGDTPAEPSVSRADGYHSPTGDWSKENEGGSQTTWEKIEKATAKWRKKKSAQAA